MTLLSVFFDKTMTTRRFCCSSPFPRSHEQRPAQHQDRQHRRGSGGHHPRGTRSLATATLTGLRDVARLLYTTHLAAGRLVKSLSQWARSRFPAKPVTVRFYRRATYGMQALMQLYCRWPPKIFRVVRYARAGSTRAGSRLREASRVLRASRRTIWSFLLWRTRTESAQRAESEKQLWAQQAQRLAREAIAREMHDVLSHRLTLLSVHAGALEFRPDASREEIVRAAGVIREAAHEALQDLRGIIGVLRAGEPYDMGRPQPTLAALHTLVAEARQAGAKVVFDYRVTAHGTVPIAVGRTAYRIAQEGLTNARKHAPRTEVTLSVTGGPGSGLEVVVRNPLPAGDVPPVPGSGQGLIGLTERAALAGGTLKYGPDTDSGFEIRAWLPWT